MTLHNEKNWLRKFYQGTLLVKGWDARMAEILQQVPADQASELAQRLTALGAKIGPEWAKGNRTRRIDTLMLQEWGDHLRRCRNQNPLRLLSAIQSIEEEVDRILSS